MQRILVMPLIALGLLLPIGACGEESGGGGGEKAPDGEKEKPSGGGGGAGGGESDCGIKATDDCTPHVGPDGKVRVDAFIYRVPSVGTAKTVGSEFTEEKASGVFVVARIKVRSDKDESATLSDDTIKLSVPDGPEYSADSEGTIAVSLGGDEGSNEPFFLEDIQPDTTTTGTVVFDVPRKVLKQKPELRFNELGFGSTHGYIRLPSLSGGV